jgi:hypothetical protein
VGNRLQGRRPCVVPLSQCDVVRSRAEGCAVHSPVCVPLRSRRQARFCVLCGAVGSARADQLTRTERFCEIGEIGPIGVRSCSTLLRGMRRTRVATPTARFPIP